MSWERFCSVSLRQIILKELRQLLVKYTCNLQQNLAAFLPTIFVRMSPPWFVDERCRVLKIVSSFEALAVNTTSPSVIVGSQVVPNSDAGFCQIPLQLTEIASKIAWLGRSSIFSFCWTIGGNIKQIMFHAQRGLQGAKRTAGQGVMSSRGKGLGSEGRAGESV